MRPHVVFLLADDLGWANIGYNRNATPEVVTPNLDALVKIGVDLQRHYVHKFCSPTRCAIQTGRAPIHVNVVNASPLDHNDADPVGGFAGIARNMTGLGDVMKRGGYATHFIGKWDAGMATPDHTPAGRGYDTSLSYFHHANDYWTFATPAFCTFPNTANGDSDDDSDDDGSGKDTAATPRAPVKLQMRDLWNYEPDPPTSTAYPGRPAASLQNSDGCRQKTQSPPAGAGTNWTCVYEDEIFEARVNQTIENHAPIAPTTPLFLFWAAHVAHGPLQVPAAAEAKFSFITDSKSRRLYHAMVYWLDAAVGRVQAKLAEHGMWERTLFIFASDNGGALSAGANNYPLRGGKFSNWEGGIRTAAFISGGFVPTAVRGTQNFGLIAGWDWYATLASLAGVDPTDTRAAAANLPPIDSLNAWPMLSGATETSPRMKLIIGGNTGGNSKGANAGQKHGKTVIGGIIVPPFKLILGYGPATTESGGLNNTVDYATWTGLQNPNASAHTTPWTDFAQPCGRTAATGCLYNIYEDEEEYHNLAPTNAAKFVELLAMADTAAKTVYSPKRGDETVEGHAAGCRAANATYGGWWGPFLP